MVGDQVEAREVDQRSDGCFIDSVKLHGGLFLRRIGGANLVGDLNQLEVVFAYRLLRYRQKAEVLIRFACCSSQQVLKGLGLRRIWRPSSTLPACRVRYHTLSKQTQA